MTIIFQSAASEDAQDLARLINSAYRGEQGWTTESALVAGDRVTLAEVVSLIESDDDHLLTALADGVLVACLCVTLQGDTAYIGTFAVAAEFQNRGLGKALLAVAEKYAVQRLTAKELVMVVISQRRELIEFYQRRGYRQTGEVAGYPRHLNVGTPLSDDLSICYLNKYPTSAE